jgi:methylmalonyl-CoA carboxyltransferase small subunit
VKLKIQIDAKAFEVDVEVLEEDPVAAAPRSPAVQRPSQILPPPAPAQNGGPIVDDAKACKSPIAGVVVKVLVGPGQAVTANEPLLVLEAMKMESSITAPRDGKVAKVHVKPGDAVQTGQAVMELE